MLHNKLYNQLYCFWSERFDLSGGVGHFDSLDDHFSGVSPCSHVEPIKHALASRSAVGPIRKRDQSQSLHLPVLELSFVYQAISPPAPSQSIHLTLNQTQAMSWCEIRLLHIKKRTQKSRGRQKLDVSQVLMSLLLVFSFSIFPRDANREQWNIQVNFGHFRGSFFTPRSSQGSIMQKSEIWWI